jgi:lauroyl/myristoyl acyltransferase
LEFLGKPTLVPASPVELARLADAIVVPAVAIPLDDGRIRLVCHGAVDPARSDPDQAVADLTRRLLEPFEAQIQTDPTQWHGIANAHRRLATTDFVEASDTSTY